MKRCSDCNIEMIENITIDGQHPFELGANGRSDIRILVPGDGLLGKIYFPKARLCPKCGKLELYVPIEVLNK